MTFSDPTTNRTATVRETSHPGLFDVHCREGRPMTAARCDGCSDCHPDVRRYTVTTHDGAVFPSMYCDECAALARIDWSGEIATITREETDR